MQKDEQQREERGETRDERQLRGVAAGRPQDAEAFAKFLAFRSTVSQATFQKLTWRESPGIPSLRFRCEAA
jgi:hypothetical protein